MRGEVINLLVYLFPLPFQLQYPDARIMQINLTGFLDGKNAREFMAELWTLLISAEDSADGIPAAILEQKKDELKKRMV